MERERVGGAIGGKRDWRARRGSVASAQAQWFKQLTYPCNTVLKLMYQSNTDPRILDIMPLPLPQTLLLTESGDD
jgi:hypothetical protein